MPFRLKVSLIVLALLIVVFTVVPLFLGSSEPPGARPLAEVAGPEAEYVEVEGVALHVERYGGEAEASAELQAEARAEPAAEPAERLILLLHGFPFSTASFDAPAAAKQRAAMAAKSEKRGRCVLYSVSCTAPAATLSMKLL